MDVRLMRWSVCLAVCWCGSAAAQELISRDPEALRKLPIAFGNSEIVKLLQTWQREGTAAGNVGDWYDNRDGEHSPLDLRLWPQLQKAHYTEPMLKARVHWAAQLRTLPAVVFGNSSTSAQANAGGSNARQLYSTHNGLNILERQYLGNNLYIYPEHRDHDPGRNARGPTGEEGYGDLFPTNTPYLIVSQGSSGSDQPFMKAIPYTLAAFRPEVKTKLVETGMLMPTLQMIFRASNKNVTEGEYLTAKAHPSVFEGANVDAIKMVRMAHEITLETLPPLVRLKAIDEDRPTANVDYFEPGHTEQLGDTSAVIARIFRGKDWRRKMIISAAESSDPNKKPLKYEWKVLRGDPKEVKITPKNAASSIVEIDVRYPFRRPITPGAPIDSNRIDIGAFVHNGSHWSAPGFVTWMGLDHEARTYDKSGRIAEIAYGSGENRLSVADWYGLLAPANEKWFPPLTEPQRDGLAQLANEKAVFLATAQPEDKAKREAAARAFHDKQQQTFLALFGPTHLRRLVELVQTDLANNPLYRASEAAATEPQRTAIRNAIERRDAFAVKLDPKLKDLPLLKTPTSFDRELDEWLNAERLSRLVFPGIVQAQRLVNYVDVHLTAPRIWRDVYLYDGDECVGWARIDPARKEPAYFTADGLLVVERDDLGRCKKAKYVAYAIDKQPGRVDRLVWTPAAGSVDYGYRDANDRRGKRKS